MKTYTLGKKYNKRKCSDEKKRDKKRKDGEGGERGENAHLRIFSM